MARSFGDPNMQLDFSNPEVVRWQLSGPDNSFSVEKIAQLGYDAIAADEYGFGNGWEAYGAFRNSKWVQLYNATDAGNKAFADANVQWIQRFYAGVKQIKSRKGTPMLLTPNWGIGGSERWDDPNVLA